MKRVYKFEYLLLLWPAYAHRFRESVEGYRYTFIAPGTVILPAEGWRFLAFSWTPREKSLPVLPGHGWSLHASSCGECWELSALPQVALVGGASWRWVPPVYYT